MAWTTPKTWSSGTLTSVDLNTYMRDNQNAIKGTLENNDQYSANEGSDYTTSSSTFVDIDATNFALTITTLASQSVLIGFFGVLEAGSACAVDFEIDIDGSPYGGDDGLIRQGVQGSTLSVNETHVSFVTLATGLSAGSHTFKVQWKTTSSVTLYAGAGTSNRDHHPQFFVQEI